MKRLLFTLSIAALAVGFGGCATSPVDDFCHSRLPDFTEKLDNALVVLRSWEDDRSPASDGTPARRPAAELTLDDRRSWAEWAVARLKETQRYQDRAMLDPNLRDARTGLTAIANGWVSFDGYASLSQIDRMITILDHMRRESGDVSARVCSAPTR